MSWNFGSKKKAAILAAVLGGCLMGQVAWAETSGPISGPETLNADREITSSEFTPCGSNKKVTAFYTGASSSKGQPMVVDLNGHNLTIHA